MFNLARTLAHPASSFSSPDQPAEDHARRSTTRGRERPDVKSAGSHREKEAKGRQNERRENEEEKEREKQRTSEKAGVKGPGERQVKNQSSLCSALYCAGPFASPNPVHPDYPRDRAPQPFNLCIANATPYLLPRPSGLVRAAGQAEGETADSSRDCYFNEISLNAGREREKGERNGRTVQEEEKRRRRRTNLASQPGGSGRVQTRVDGDVGRAG